LRVEKLVQLRGEKACQTEKDLALLYLHESLDVFMKAGKDAVNAFAVGEEQRAMLMGLRRFTKIEPINKKETCQRIAQVLIEKNEYPFAVV
jgi:hypothetical protein